MDYTLIDHTSADWPAHVDALYQQLAHREAETVPQHFIKTTFVNMGGRLLTCTQGDTLHALGLLFPRLANGDQRVYTLRLQQLKALPPDAELQAAVEQLIAPASIVLYRPEQAHEYPANSQQFGEYDLGHPAQHELAALQQVYSAIWGVPADAGYPSDLYSADFAPGSSLVARHAGEVVGFLLGFRRFGLAALEALGLPLQLQLGIESQIMGVSPTQRRSGLAATLKRKQAQQALSEGIDLIHWTADPLQFPNAVLNFARLRAVAGEFHPSYYPVQNALNRLPASRLSISWLPRTKRGAQGLHQTERGTDLSLTRYADCVRLNDGPTQIAEANGARWIALEIPADWTAMQRDDLDTALEWRNTSDAILARYLGYREGGYVVIDAATDGERRYLVAERFSRDLLA
jgi:predicted GNAT superfamily acetyltransferase